MLPSNLIQTDKTYDLKRKKQSQRMFNVFQQPDLCAVYNQMAGWILCALERASPHYVRSCLGFSNAKQEQWKDIGDDGLWQLLPLTLALFPFPSGYNFRSLFPIYIWQDLCVLGM